MKKHRLFRVLTLAGCLAALAPDDAAADAVQDAGRRLLAAYPDHLAGVEGNEIVWRDGTRAALDDGKGKKAFEAWLADPDLEDIFAIPYPKGEPAAPALESDPGRARPQAFFDKMYGNCREGGVTPNLVEIDWLSPNGAKRLKVTRVNGVAEKLRAISAELAALPAASGIGLALDAETYNCRVIAGTDRASAHGHGIAIDIAVKHAHHWRWSKPGASGRYTWQNTIPVEIVRVFEKHGFIWGGRWYHFDTMHFEYRPELLTD